MDTFLWLISAVGTGLLSSIIFEWLKPYLAGIRDGGRDRLARSKSKSLERRYTSAQNILNLGLLRAQILICTRLILSSTALIVSIMTLLVFFPLIFDVQSTDKVHFFKLMAKNDIDMYSNIFAVITMLIFNTISFLAFRQSLLGAMDVVYVDKLRQACLSRGIVIDQAPRDPVYF